MSGVPRQSCCACPSSAAHHFILLQGAALGWVLFCLCDYSSCSRLFPENPSHAPILLRVICHFYYCTGFSLIYRFKFTQMKVDLSTFQSPHTTVTHLPALYFSITFSVHSPVFPTHFCSGSFVVIIVAPKNLNSVFSTWLATTGKWCWLSWMNWLRGWTDNHRNY